MTAANILCAAIKSVGSVGGSAVGSRLGHFPGDICRGARPALKGWIAGRTPHTAAERQVRLTGSGEGPCYDASGVDMALVTSPHDG